MTRIGAVSYLNTKPLVYELDRLAAGAEIVYDLPSRLADGLAAATLDVALIPSVEMFRNPGYRIVSDACIACRGPVLSVRLLARVPMREIRTLALDEGSRTSVALTTILLRERFGLDPERRPFPIGAAIGSIDADAVLIIGDRAIPPTDNGPAASRPPAMSGVVEAWDLGEEWCRWSGLPFVFATWTARPGVDLGDVERALCTARDRGLANVDAIARREAAAAGLSHDACVAYFREHLYFRLGEREIEGLTLFHRHAARLGLVPAGWTPPRPRRDR